MLKNFHFIKNRKITLIILAVVFIVGILSFIIRGFNIDIDFSGGSELQLDLGKEVTEQDCDDINDIIRNHELLGNEYVSSTRPSSAEASSSTVIIRTGTAFLSKEQQSALYDALEEKFPDADLASTSFTNISPTIGKSLTRTAIISVIVAVALMMVYICIRFQLFSGIAAVACLIHDMFVMFTLYSLLQIPINSNVIAALLTILGYSINATIIVFDRVRENKAKMSGSFDDVVNVSVHQTLARSINTTLTTLFTIGMIYIFGVDSIRNFALPLIVGILAGLFSSVFVSSMLWSALEAKFGKKEKKARKTKKVKS